MPILWSLKREEVVEVLLVHLDDLYLRHEQVGEGESVGIDCQPVLEIHCVVHAELVQEHLDMSVVDVVLELQPLVAVEDVERLVRDIPEVDERLLDDGRLCAQPHEVDVRVGPLAEFQAGAVHSDSYAAHDPELYSL